MMNDPIISRSVRIRNLRAGTSYNAPSGRPTYRCCLLDEAEGGDWAEENWETVDAITAEDAAETWSEEYDQYDEMHIARGNPTKVVVLDPQNVKQVFEVSGEFVPTYSATEVKDDAK